MIADLCAEYFIACDNQDVEHLAALFTDDIRITATNGMLTAVGLDAAIEIYRKMFSIRGPSYHWSHDRLIHFDDSNPDRATGVVFAHAETTPRGTASIAAIRYRDTYAKRPDRWQFSARTLDFLYYTPMVQFIERFPGELRVLGPEGWIPADLPERQT